MCRCLAGFGDPKVSKTHLPLGAAAWGKAGATRLPPALPVSASLTTTLRLAVRPPSWGGLDRNGVFAGRRWWGRGGPSRSCTQRGPSRSFLHPACGCRALGAQDPRRGQEGLWVGRLGGCQDRRLWTFRAGHPGRWQPLRPPSAGLERSENRRNSKMPTKGLPVDTNRLRLLSPLHPVLAPWPCCIPQDDNQATERKSTHRPPTLRFVFLKIGFEIQILLTGTSARLEGPASTLQNSCCGYREMLGRPSLAN